MDQLVEALAGQIVEEQQTYLDNARLKHGVTRGQSGLARVPNGSRSAGTGTDPGQPAAPHGGDQQGSVAPTAQKSIVGSVLKTAAKWAIVAGAGAVGIPPIVSTVATHWLGSKIDPASNTAPASNGTPAAGTAPQWKDLVGWIREEGIDRGK